jgi:hypothetical protein
MIKKKYSRGNKMNKTIAFIAMFALVLAFVAAPVAAVSATMISGKITLSDNVTPVVGASVKVTCNAIDKLTTTDGSGMYYVFYTSTDCPNGSEVTTVATKDDMTGTSTGKVSLDLCRINTAIIDVSIPEFGIVLGGVALVGAFGAFMVMRKK